MTYMHPEIRGAHDRIAHDLLDKEKALTRLKAAEVLLQEALASVDADEQARAESWPKEVEKGELTLDLGDRIRAFLEVGQDAGS